MNTIKQARASLMRAWMCAALALSVFLPSLANAAAIEQFKQFAATTRSARGEFTQRQVKIENGSMRALNQSSGTFVFAKPGRFIWTYARPYEQVLQADGQKLYIHDKDLNQVTVRKLGDALGSSPAAILFGSSDLEKSFVLKEVGARENLQWLEAVPRKRDTSFERIGIGMKDGLPHAMELRDSFGNVTLLTFTRFEKNPPVRGDQFRFVIPKGADVFQQ